MVKILIIDDDRMNCELLQAVFTRHGYEVLTATSGADGLTLFHREVPRVTILDLRMPEMDGLTVLKEIRAQDPAAPVVILGGGATEVQENQARALRVTDFIRKGLSLDVLVEAVMRVMQQTPRSGVEISAASPGISGSDNPETILVIDDEQLVRDLLVQFLNLRGYRAVGAKDGQHALDLTERTAPDLVLLDLFLPGMGGVEVLRRLRQSGFEGPVIVITGSQDEEVLEEAWALRPQEVLSKPVDLERMLSIIQLVLVCREC
ncbi:response regulator [Nitrospira sp. KM1]|uniref:response regulator n=1 Tax=Nitrospira sp. KM1 TaxID=1936990 RepID=UPI0021074FAA|nr:response regulator [Nitrospira sp. KM1]